MSRNTPHVMSTTDPAWRSSADRRVPGLALALLLAALLRFWGLGQGIPFNPGVDEPEVMDRALRMMKSGDFNPHFFDYPSLYMYVQTAVAVLRFMIGAMQGRWSALAQAQTADFYLWARGVTAIIGTGTVWLVYRAGTRWGPRTALLAAVMLAVMPLHVRESHYALTDVPMTFFVVLTLLLSLRAHERATAWSFVAAGAAAGLAGATKYNGLIAFLIPLLACATTRAAQPSRLQAILWTTAGLLAAFLMAAPYTLIDLPHFLNQFARLISEYRTPGLQKPMWVTYLKHLRAALGWPGSVLVTAGLILGAGRVLAGPDRVKWLLVIAFPLVYFWFISNQTIVFGRYLLPLVPFLSLIAADTVVWIVTQLRAIRMPRPVRAAAILGMVIVVIVPPGYTAISFGIEQTKVSTSALAYDWVRREIPPGTTIWLEGSVAIKLPPEYRATYLKQLRQADLERVSLTAVQYLVASSQSYGEYLDAPKTYPQEYQDYQRIFNETQEVARFTPSREHPGPELRILKVRR